MSDIENLTALRDGILARVTGIQRIHTEGGNPPLASDCNSTRVNARARSRYAADYFFYAPRPE